MPHDLRVVNVGRDWRCVLTEPGQPSHTLICQDEQTIVDFRASLEARIVVDVAGGQLDPRKSWQDLERGPNGLAAERR